LCELFELIIRKLAPNSKTYHVSWVIGDSVYQSVPAPLDEEETANEDHTQYTSDGLSATNEKVDSFIKVRYHRSTLHSNHFTPTTRSHDGLGLLLGQSERPRRRRALAGLSVKRCTEMNSSSSSIQHGRVTNRQTD